MIIRKSTTKDIEELEILFQFVCQQTFTSRPKNEFQIGDYQKSTVNDEVWIAEENSLIIGFISIFRADNFVHNLFVHPAYQRRGIGTQLLQIVEPILARPMLLKISLDNVRAGSFYEKHGWYQVSNHKTLKESYISYRKN